MLLGIRTRSGGTGAEGRCAGVLPGRQKLGEVNVLTNGSIREAGYMDYLKKRCGGLEAEPAVANSLCAEDYLQGLIFRVMK